MKIQAPFNPDLQEELVKDIFAKIAPRYDFLNHLLSFGQDKVWRNTAVRKMRFFKTYRCLDVATGTGDVAFEISKLFPRVSIVGIDFSPEMINIAKFKKNNKYPKANVSFQTGDATQIPFEDHSFDVSIIAFGIRNIPDKIAVLQEMCRVTQPGGQVMILEMVSQQSQWFQSLYQGYLCHLLPRIARIFSPHRKAYRYLGKSILYFPSVDDFLQMMENSGIIVEGVLSMTCGIVRLFVGKKQKNPLC